MNNDAIDHGSPMHRPPTKLATVNAYLLTILNGALLGIANIIPGVSGGTFALILGIFDRLINAINAINMSTVKKTLTLLIKPFSPIVRRQFGEEFHRIDGGFLSVLLLTAAASASGLSFLMTYLLAHQTCPTLAFFIGLIVPSIAVPWSMMDKKGARLLLIAPGFVLTAIISTLVPEQSAGNNHLLIALGSGALSISAMILPGISGSFVLLILGQYQHVLTHITGLLRDLTQGEVNLVALIWLVTFALGMLIGLFAFTRLLALLLKKAKAATMAFLIGLILGSLFVLWPFKDISTGANVVSRSGQIKHDVQIATANNRMPQNSRETGTAAMAFVVGLGGAIGLIKLGKKSTQR